MNASIRILIADDHPIVRDGLAAVLNTQPDFTVVGAAAGGREALDLTARLGPDVLLLDIEMPDMDGVAVLRALRERGLGVRALVFTAYDSDERVLGALRLGALGYLLKGAPREEIFAAIRTVHAGGSLLGSRAAARLLRIVRRGDAPDELTPREREVLELMARGMTNKQIAAQLVITERTAKFHVSAILGKLGAGNRTEAVRAAVERGLIALD